MSVDYASSKKIGLLVGEEGTPGEEASTIDKVIGVVQDAGPLIKIDPIKLPTGGKRGSFYALDGAEHYGMDIDLVLQEGLLLYYLMGASSDSGDTVFQHDITFFEPIPSLTVENIATDLSRSTKIIGSKINELSLSGTIGQEIRAKVNMVGTNKKKETTSVGTPATIAKDPFVYHQSTLTVNSVNYSDVLQSFDLVFRQNIRELGGSAQANPKHLVEGKLEAELTMEVASQNAVLLDILVDRTEFATSLKFVRVASDDEILITIPNCKVFDIDEPYNLEDDFIKTMLPISIFKPHDITATIKDDIAVY